MLNFQHFATYFNILQRIPCLSFVSTKVFYNIPAVGALKQQFRSTRTMHWVPKVDDIVQRHTPGSVPAYNISQQYDSTNDTRHKTAGKTGMSAQLTEKAMHYKNN